MPNTLRKNEKYFSNIGSCAILNRNGAVCFAGVMQKPGNASAFYPAVFI